MHAHTEGFRVLFTLARFTIDARDYEEFLYGTHCSSEPEQIDPQSVATSASYYSQYPWWNPYDAKILVECEGSTDHFSQTILIDVSEQDFFTVYITGSMH